MPNEVEIDHPLPGDSVGRTVEVGGTYSLEGGFFGEFKIVVLFLQADGDPALKADGTTQVPPQITPASGSLGSGDNMPWSVTFSLDADYDDHQFRAELRGGSEPLDTDVVEDVGVRLVAGADILFLL